MTAMNLSEKGALDRVANEYAQVCAGLDTVGKNMKNYRAETDADIAKISARLQDMEQKAARRGDDPVGYGESSGDSLGARVADSFEGSAPFQHLVSGNEGTARATVEGLSVRAALTHDNGQSSGGHYMPSQPASGGIIGPLIPQPRLIQFLGSRQVSSDAVEYIQFETSGDADVQAAEGDEKAEIEFQGTRRRANICTIAAHTTASRQVLQDHVQLQNLIDSVLRQKLTNKLSEEIIAGTGSDYDDDPRINGLLNRAVHLALPQTTTFADRIGEAIVEMQELGFNPNVVVANPKDWLMHIATIKTQTEGVYLFGNPASPIPPALWNRPVALEPGLDEGTSLVLDTSYISILDRESTSVLVSNSHKDNFTRNLVTILGELRAGLEVLDVGSVWIIEPDSNQST